MTSEFGSVRRLPSGKYQARYRLPSGEPRSAGTHVTRAAAQKRLAEIEVDLRRGEHWDGRKGQLRFRDFMEIYMEHRSRSVTAGELANNRSYLSVHLLPVFGHMKMAYIDEEVIDRWYAEQRPSETRRNVYGFLRRAFKSAVKWKYVRHSPCNVMDQNKWIAPARPTWSYQDFKTVLEFVPESVTLGGVRRTVPTYYKEAFEVMFAAHLRLGELVALNAGDYDRGQKLLLVERQITARGSVTATKSGTVKKIRPLSPGISAIENLPPRIGAAPLIPGVTGSRVSRSTLQKVWRRAVEAAGLENYHLHDIRHVGLSLVAETKAPLKDIMNRGGHSSPQSAMRYQHTNQDRDRKLAEETDRMLSAEGF